MLGFWETKMKDKMISMYSFAPFLEEAGTLLLGAKYLWHPWSIKRIDELAQASHTLKDAAKTLRQRGLAWGGNALELGGDTTHLLSTSVYYRYHGHSNDGAKISCPEAAPYMVSTAAKLLFTLLPSFQKVEKVFSEEEYWIKWLPEIIEKIVEAPYYNQALEIPNNILRIAGMHGVLTECEGLAYTQATIEDSFNKNNENRKRKKKSNLSEAELRKLALEIGMPFKAVKETFKTEFSSWWDQVKKYSNLAQTQRKGFLSSMSAENRIKEAIMAVWDPGMPTQYSHPECLSESNLKKSEVVITTFISMLLFFAEHEKSGQFTAALKKSSKKVLQ